MVLTDTDSCSSVYWIKMEGRLFIYSLPWWILVLELHWWWLFFCYTYAWLRENILRNDSIITNSCDQLLWHSKLKLSLLNLLCGTWPKSPPTGCKKGCRFKALVHFTLQTWSYIYLSYTVCVKLGVSWYRNRLWLMLHLTRHIWRFKVLEI